MGCEHQDAAAVEVGLPGVHGELALGELIDAMAQPLRVEAAADPVAVVSDAQNDRAAAHGVGHAGDLPSKVGGRLLACRRTRRGVAPTAPSGFLLNIYLGGLDLRWRLPVGQAPQCLGDLLLQ